jgi:hypothetical protein
MKVRVDYIQEMLVIIEIIPLLVMVSNITHCPTSSQRRNVFNLYFGQCSYYS